MKTYSFTVVLSERQATEDMADKLFDAGCDDGLFGQCHGVVQVGFDRESSSMEDAVTSAVRQIVAAGYKVKRIETDEAEVASLIAS